VTHAELLPYACPAWVGLHSKSLLQSVVKRFLQAATGSEVLPAAPLDPPHPRRAARTRAGRVRCMGSLLFERCRGIERLLS
jgi:hypothetical protein